jgi:hypothetical protein
VSAAAAATRSTAANGVALTDTRSAGGTDYEDSDSDEYEEYDDETGFDDTFSVHSGTERSGAAASGGDVNTTAVTVTGETVLSASKEADAETATPPAASGITGAAQ